MINKSQTNNNDQNSSSILFSKACGKVLICGGYGVLEQNNIGLSLALENSFYCRLKTTTVVDDQDSVQGKDNIQEKGQGYNSSKSIYHFYVDSPQIHKKYHYVGVVVNNDDNDVDNDVDNDNYDQNTEATTTNTTDKFLKQVDKQENIFVQNALQTIWRYFIVEKQNIIVADKEKQVQSETKTTIKHEHKHQPKRTTTTQFYLTLIFDKGFIQQQQQQQQQSSTHHHQQNNKSNKQQQLQLFAFPIYKSDKYKKTGLGSSACVVVSIVKVLSQYFLYNKGNDLINESYQKNSCNNYCGQSPNQKHNNNKHHYYNPNFFLHLVNVLSQVANLSAQKKIGSNFDISTAVYGTHLYKNVIPYKAYEYVLKQDGNQNQQQNKEIKGQKLLSDLILSTYESKSKLKQSQLQQQRLSNFIQKDCFVSYMINFSKGANTRVMVGGFLKNLKKQSPQTQEQFFAKSKQLTQRLYDALMKPIPQNPILLKPHLSQINQQHRKLQQKFSKITQTSVEPQQLTQFIDQLMKDDNVLYAICPGSGGFDALFLLGLNIINSANSANSANSSLVNYEYYENLVEKAIINSSKSLKQHNISIRLNPVNIQWNLYSQSQSLSLEKNNQKDKDYTNVSFNKVTQKQINQIEKFIQKNNQFKQIK